MTTKSQQKNQQSKLPSFNCFLSNSVEWFNACVVKCCCVKPNWKEQISCFFFVFFSENVKSLLKMILSRILSIYN